MKAEFSPNQMATSTSVRPCEGYITECVTRCYGIAHHPWATVKHPRKPLPTTRTDTRMTTQRPVTRIM